MHTAYNPEMALHTTHRTKPAPNPHQPTFRRASHVSKFCGTTCCATLRSGRRHSYTTACCTRQLPAARFPSITVATLTVEAQVFSEQSEECLCAGLYRRTETGHATGRPAPGRLREAITRRDERGYGRTAAAKRGFGHCAARQYMGIVATGPLGAVGEGPNCTRESTQPAFRTLCSRSATISDMRAKQSEYLLVNE